MKESHGHATAIILLIGASLFPQSLSADESAGKGLTWVKHRHSQELRIDYVGCGGCNAYQGDTSCREARPILCLKVDHSPRPPYEITGEDHAMPKEYYQGWAAGTIALTASVIGMTLESRGYADAICREQLGDGYRMAEFHDGNGGWNFWAFGNVPSDSRFWVAIDDQPANCWDYYKKPLKAPDYVKPLDKMTAPDHAKASAPIFKCRDVDGSIIFSDKPCIDGARDGDGKWNGVDDDR